MSGFRMLICFRHHCVHHQELKSIIQWLLPVVFGAAVFKLLVWCGAEGYVSGLEDDAFYFHSTIGVNDFKDGYAFVCPVNNHVITAGTTKCKILYFADRASSYDSW